MTKKLVFNQMKQVYRLI